MAHKTTLIDSENLSCRRNRIAIFFNKLVLIACARKERKRLQSLLSEVLLYWVGQTGSILLSVLRVREVSVFGVFLYRDYRISFRTCVSVRFNASVRRWEVSVNGGSTVVVCNSCMY